MRKRYHNLISAVLTLIVILLTIFFCSETLPLSNEIIKQRIEEKAADVLELKGTKVRVTVENGVVFLSGSVRLYTQKMRYETLAWQTMGVARIKNEIRVNPESPIDDIAIDEKIKALIQTHRRLQDFQLRVTVKDGTVALEGNFGHPRDVLFLKLKVAEIEGVIEIKIQAHFNL